MFYGICFTVFVLSWRFRWARVGVSSRPRGITLVCSGAVGMCRENWGEFFDEVLGVAKTAVDACETNERDFVEATESVHAEVSDVLGGYFSFIVI